MSVPGIARRLTRKAPRRRQPTGSRGRTAPSGRSCATPSTPAGSSWGGPATPAPAAAPGNAKTATPPARSGPGPPRRTPTPPSSASRCGSRPGDRRRAGQRPRLRHPRPRAPRLPAARPPVLRPVQTPDGRQELPAQEGRRQHLLRLPAQPQQPPPRGGRPQTPPRRHPRTSHPRCHRAIIDTICSSHDRAQILAAILPATPAEQTNTTPPAPKNYAGRSARPRRQHGLMAQMEHLGADTSPAARPSASGSRPVHRRYDQETRQAELDALDAARRPPRTPPCSTNCPISPKASPAHPTT